MLGIFLDSETNGLNANKHSILEIAFKILDMRSGVLCTQFESLIKATISQWDKSDPNSLAINGFGWDEVSTAPSIESVAQEIYTIFAQQRIQRGDSIFICQNPSFDRVFFSQIIDADMQEQLNWPYHWLDLASMHWAQSIANAKNGVGKFPWETGCSKDKIATFLHLPKEKKPHRAMNGVDHLILCYEAIVGFPNNS